MAGLIKEEDINEIREKIDLIDIISDYIVLKKTGRTFKGLCPFHKEKTPSFIVDPVKQLYYCFGCGEGGNVFTFTMKMDNLDFPESVKYLADKVGYTIHYADFDKSSSKHLSDKERILEINLKALLFYHYILTKTEEGKLARDYLGDRGYNSEVINFFKLGYAPDKWDALLNYLKKQKFSIDDLVAAGLIVKGEKSDSSFYDRFRSRAIFPILDLHGRPIAFGGRVLNDSLPKYINSPETKVYHKGSNLYGLWQAKSEIVKAGYVVVVEGYTDVISLYSAGIKNVVASLGTAFTPSQIKLLSRFTNKIIMVFDADAAGSSAAERGFGLINEADVDIYVASLPEGTDPADFVKEYGSDEFKKFLSLSVPLVDFCLFQAISRFNVSESKERIKASKAALGIIGSLENAVAREEYLKKTSQLLGVSYTSLSLELNRKKQPEKSAQKTSIRTSPATDNELKIRSEIENEIIKFIIQRPKESLETLSDLNEEYFSQDASRKLFRLLKVEILEKQNFSTANLINRILDDDSLLRSGQDLRNLASKLAFDKILADDETKYLENISNRLKEFELQRQINNLKNQLDQLSPSGDASRYDMMFEELLTLETAKRRLRGKV